ncbi:hypothetical protein OG196_05020 [Kitasatospora purpeofusca]|uniref:hypothetical protein n=1 Tax=Kitasatospora purpeofusca TaxID=67352 RepID=UPI002E1109D7|nr:hypothetical protein OG196_05020 [Kitasatospora purpeofusca]
MNLGAAARATALLAALLAGAAACGPAESGSGAAASRSGTAAAPASPSGAGSADGAGDSAAGFPETLKRSVLEQAARDGRSPAGGRTVLAGFDSGARPYLVWQSGSTGDICVALNSDGGSAVTQCSNATELATRAVPGAALFLSARRAEGQGRPVWNVLLLSSGETVERISCRQQDFAVRKAFTTEVGGVERTVWTATVPDEPGGDYRAAVRRGGEPTVDTVRIDPGSRGGQC